MNRESFEAFMASDEKFPDGCNMTERVFNAGYQAGLASQAQQPEYTFDQLTKMMMQAATKEGHKVTMKIKWALPPAPEGEKE